MRAQQFSRPSSRGSSRPSSRNSTPTLTNAFLDAIDMRVRREETYISPSESIIQDIQSVKSTTSLSRGTDGAKIVELAADEWFTKQLQIAGHSMTQMLQIEYKQVRAEKADMFNKITKARCKQQNLHHQLKLLKAISKERSQLLEGAEKMVIQLSEERTATTASEVAEFNHIEQSHLFHDRLSSLELQFDRLQAMHRRLENKRSEFQQKLIDFEHKQAMARQHLVEESNRRADIRKGLLSITVSTLSSAEQAWRLQEDRLYRQHSAELVRKHVEQQHEIDVLKIRFFNDVLEVTMHAMEKRELLIIEHLARVDSIKRYFGHLRRKRKFETLLKKERMESQSFIEKVESNICALKERSRVEIETKLRKLGNFSPEQIQILSSVQNFPEDAPPPFQYEAESFPSTSFVDPFEFNENKRATSQHQVPLPEQEMDVLEELSNLILFLHEHLGLGTVMASENYKIESDDVQLLALDNNLVQQLSLLEQSLGVALKQFTGNAALKTLHDQFLKELEAITIRHSADENALRLSQERRYLSAKSLAAQELELEATRYEIEGVTNAVVDALIMSDEKATMIFCNKAAIQLFGYSEEECLGNNVRMFCTANVRKEHDSYVQRYLQTRSGVVVGTKGRVVKGQHKNGSVIPLHFSLAASVVRGKTLFVGNLHRLDESNSSRTKNDGTLLSLLTGIPKCSSIETVFQELYDLVSLDMSFLTKLGIRYDDIFGKQFEAKEMKGLLAMQRFVEMFLICEVANKSAEPVFIIPGLYLGSLGAAMNRNWLHSNGITHLLEVHGSSTSHVYTPKDFIHRKVDLQAFTSSSHMLKILEDTNQFISESINSVVGGKILVYCLTGISFSPAFVTAYLMQMKSMTLEHALTTVRGRATQLSISSSLVDQLKQFEEFVEKRVLRTSSTFNKIG